MVLPVACISRYPAVGESSEVCRRLPLEDRRAPGATVASGVCPRWASYPGAMSRTEGAPHAGTPDTGAPGGGESDSGESDTGADLDAAVDEREVWSPARTRVAEFAPAPPPADLLVDIARIRRIAEQWIPEPGVPWARGTLTVGTRPLGEGWDNVLWPVGELDGQPLVARVPRRASARDLLSRELVVLRFLATQDAELTMQLPVPLATGPDAMVIPWIQGATAAAVDAAGRSAVALELARMLGQVHSLPVPPLERNPVRGVPLATRADAFAADLGRAGLGPGQRRRALARWARGITAPAWSHEDRLLHGDPHPGNVVVPAGPGRSALIDWGDATTGDPASDLGALLLHDPSAEVLGDYRVAASWPGIEDDAVWDALARRAGAWGTRMALSLSGAYGPDHPLGRSGRRLLGERTG